MVAKAEKTGGGEAAASNHHSRRRRTSNKPSWLLCAIADLDEKMKMLTRKIPKGNSPDSFAERANSYYHERPQLLALLDDLYNGYLSLADRYCQALAKNQQQQKPHSRCSSPNLRQKFEDATTQPDEGDAGEVIDSDAESSLSFQPPTAPPVEAREIDADMVVADLVMKAVEYDVIMNELSVVEKRWSESSRKMELQKNLLDVLESERLILLNDNATLGYRVSALVEENTGLASESMFLKRKAAELARCVLKTREDHRVCMLSRKIEDLQGQIYGLEKRNKEYYDQLVKQEEKNMSKGTKSKGGDQVNLEDCFRVGAGGGAIRLSKCFSFNVKKSGDQNSNCDQNPNGDVEGKKVSKLWDKVKKFDLFQCGSHFDAAST
ncbi:hypothetical protein C2S52_018898 [Perilla frutescens var. hirtella]|nr:hypothetical protein C2S52_018898 [Perilla frutescens var. hirtella]KAH6806769.1 hypothetical protein C2S51_031600 [Perilla frutescens var. frutescens]